MNKFVMLLLLSLASLTLSAQLLWNDAVPIRQGVNIEWFRTADDTNDGCAVYVWSDTKRGDRDMYAQKVNAQGQMVWGEPLLVDGKPDRQEDPVITKTSDGNFIIAWIDFFDDVDGNVYAQKVSNAGQLMWQTGGKPVCVLNGIQISLNIEPDDNGGAYIVWEDSRNPSKDIFGQHLDSNGNPVWTVNGIAIANGFGDESYNTMWRDGTGGMIIGYVYAISGEEDLYIKRFNAAGTMVWTQALELCAVPGKQNKIKMSPINNDSFVFTWQDQRHLDTDIYAQRVNLNGQFMWPNPFIVYTDSTATTPTPQENPRIVQTSDNAVIIVWEDKRYDYDDPDLFCQKVSLTGQRLWDVNGVPLSIAPFSQSGPRLEADGSGGSFIAWDDTRNGNTPNIDIYAQHISSSGSALWEANGRAICTAPNEQSNCLIKQSSNNIYINWLDRRDGSDGIRYQVLNQAGVAQLQENGIVVFWGLSGDATKDQIVILNRGGDDAIIVWQDTRFANLGYQNFFQGLNPDGTIDYEVNGRPVTIPTGFDQITPAAVVTPDNKTAVIWEEKRTDNPKIYAQLLSANGDRLWGDFGIEITDMEPLRQKDPRISYENGYFYIGWSNSDEVVTPDFTINLYRIYGQKLDLSGNRLWGNNGLLISQIAGTSNMFECQMEELIGRYYVWSRTSAEAETFGQNNIVAILVNPDGTTATGWTDAGVYTSTYAEEDTRQYQPRATLSPDGLFIVWEDFRSDGVKNYIAQLMSFSGQRLWNPLGVVIADTGNEEDQACVIAGTNSLSWRENLGGVDEDIAIQKFSATGVPQWGNPCSYVITRDSTQASPYTIRFANGGMLTAWEDYTSLEPDIYMRYIFPNGQMDGWTQGIPVCTLVKKQQKPLIVARNQAEAFVIWSDGRSSGKTDIFGLYAQKAYNFTPNEDENADVGLPLTLQQNYPNPFNPETNITFTTKIPLADCSLTIYNIKGQQVKRLHSGYAEKGTHNLVWNGKDDNDKSVATGIYYYQLKAGHTILTRKMVMMK